MQLWAKTIKLQGTYITELNTEATEYPSVPHKSIWEIKHSVCDSENTEEKSKDEYSGTLLRQTRDAAGHLDMLLV